MDPLSVAASVAGLATAAGSVAVVASSMTDAPNHIRALASEMQEIYICMTALQRYLDHRSSAVGDGRESPLQPERAALVPLEDLVTLLTQMVLTFSEIEPIVRLAQARTASSSSSSSSDSGAAAAPILSRLTGRVSWAWQQPMVTRLVGRLHSQRGNLVLLLQTIQCDSYLDAQQFAWLLQGQIDQLVGRNRNMERRLRSLPPIDDDEDADSTRTVRRSAVRERNAVQDAEASSVVSNRRLAIASSPNPSISSFINMRSGHRHFERVLFLSRVYSRVHHREMDEGRSALTSSSFRSWSVLSGISLAQISVVAVINLPLSGAEVHRFQAIVSLQDTLAEKVRGGGRDESHDEVPSDSWTSVRGFFETVRQQDLFQSTTIVPSPKFATQLAEKGQGTARLLNDLRELLDNPPKSVFAEPVTDDLMEWDGGIYGPPDSPYHAGIFLLTIRFDETYPLRGPIIIFRTRIYHPNVSRDGRIDMNTPAGQWNATLTLRQVLLRIWLLLYEPQVDFEFHNDKMRQYSTDRTSFNRTAKKWTRMYAHVG